MESLDLAPFLEKMAHKVDRKGVVESSNVEAYRIDGSDGVSVALGFKNNQLSKADYFLFHEGDHVELIELTDLISAFKERDKYHKYLLDTHEGKLSTKQDVEYFKQANSSICSELQRKWGGSIATIERLCRRNNLPEQSYSLKVVLKNSNELRAADQVKTSLSGMVGKITLINTKEL
ncbi:hypothetical protein [Vibrio campbellii]|uniref:hypothetical protein n=1 Tax=Vibrio campbellii TaxID=680 RepID=UPI003735EF5A